MSVTPTTAILAIEGYPVVVQLTSADQAAALMARGTAQFIVTQLTDQVITLKFVRKDQPQASLPGTVFSGPELAVRLLEQNNIPVTVNHLMMARSVLKQHLPLTPGLLNDLLGALSEYGVWGAAEADLAAALKASGLPVTAQSLALAARQSAQTSASLAGLIGQLRQAAGQDLPPELLQKLNSNLQFLEDMVVHWDGGTSQMAEQLRQAVRTLGRSMESVLLEQSQNPAIVTPEKGLLSLVGLQHILEQAGKKDLAQAIDKFIGDLRQQQFINIKPAPSAERDEWSVISLMVQNAQQKAEDKFSSARLRIAREPRSDPEKPNPAYSRIILQVDVEQGGTVEVDLSLVGKQIRTVVTAPDPQWCELAEKELPSLDEALQALGYALKDAQIGVGVPQPFGGINMPPASPTLMTVDIEV
jgi:hypothetical protein